MTLLRIHPENPQQRLMDQAVKKLREGGILIYPTDTVYAIGCDIKNHRAIERLCQIKGIKLKNANFSIICNDLSHLSEYTKQIDNSVFKLMKKALPGPYTFILKASMLVPKILHHSKRTIGIRVPENRIPQDLVHQLGNPIITASLKQDDDILEYPTDPELIYEQFNKQVDLVIDGGYGQAWASTVIDATDYPVEVVREGLGSVEIL